MSPILARKSLLHSGHQSVGAGTDVLAARSFRAALFLWAVETLEDSAFWAATATLCRQCSRSWASDSQDSVARLKSFSEALRESLNLFLGRPTDLSPSWSSPYNNCLSSLVSGMRVTWSAQRSCALCSKVWMLGRFVRLSTSVSGILCCHFILSNLRRQDK